MKKRLVAVLAVVALVLLGVALANGPPEQTSDQAKYASMNLVGVVGAIGNLQSVELPIVGVAAIYATEPPIGHVFDQEGMAMLAHRASISQAVLRLIEYSDSGGSVVANYSAAYVTGNRFEGVVNDLRRTGAKRGLAHLV